jgi:hypothetical protein
MEAVCYQLAGKRAPLDQYLSNVPGAPTLVRRAVEQMEVVAQAARLTPRLYDIVASDKKTFEADLGPSPDTDLGPGATSRDPLIVYYNAQLTNFVK